MPRGPPETRLPALWGGPVSGGHGAGGQAPCAGGSRVLEAPGHGRHPSRRRRHRRAVCTEGAAVLDSEGAAVLDSEKPPPTAADGCLAAFDQPNQPAWRRPPGFRLRALKGFKWNSLEQGRASQAAGAGPGPPVPVGLHSLTRSGPLFSHGQASRVGKKLMPLPCCLVAASQSSEANSEQSQTAVAHAAAGARTHSHDRASGSLAPETQASKSQSESSVHLPALLD